ncbi:hypothetical protein C5H24_12470, partial [Xylella fastidiosa]
YEWGPEQEEAFKDLKKYLGTPPLLSKPKKGERLILYLAVSEHAISAALLRTEGTEQKPIYFVSETLLDAHTRYLPLEKLVKALIMASRKLPHYFLEHPITVYTEFPIKALLRKADFSGRISTWSVELSQYDIDFQPRTAIKGQVLADFVAEFTPTEAESPTVREYEPSPQGDDQNTGSWHLFVDGSA